MKSALVVASVIGLASLVAGSAAAHERIIYRGHYRHHPVVVAAPMVVAEPVYVESPVVVEGPVVVGHPGYRAPYYAPARIGGYYGRSGYYYGRGVGVYGRGGGGIWVGF